MLPEHKPCILRRSLATQPARSIRPDYTCCLQIDEFIKTGTFAALTEADNAVEGGDADKKGEAVESKAKVAGKDMAMKFL